jgi:hypothetical protein
MRRTPFSSRATSAEQEKAAEKLPPSLSDLWHFPEHFPSFHLISEN